MAYEEKRAWIMLVISACAYAAYLIVIVGRAGPTPLADVSYAWPLLWSVGAAVVVQIGLSIIVGGSPKARKRDQRDREIRWISEYAGHSFVVIGGVAALLMSLAELDYFWIANVIYLTFVLSATLGSVAKISAYRRGFQSW
jgi:hypothetical protein